VPLVVDRIPLGEYQANCYVVRAAPDAAEAVVIDPGGDTTPLVVIGARVAGILVTHTDVDHIDGVAELAARAGAEVWAPAGEVENLRAGRSRTGRDVPPYPAEHGVAGGDRVSLAGIGFDVVDVPGHSAGHVAYHADGELFSGDVLFAGSVGRTDLPGGDWQTLLASIEGLLDRFDADTVVHSGHGPDTTLGRELETNPFLAELRTARNA
jgi:glyoxylase-like metal-dependent hydrolase (beta-lactamase superfamily II)